MSHPRRLAINRHRRPLATTVVVPGSKSLTNRALVCAALAEGPSTVSNIAPGDDTIAMIAGLNAMGAQCIIHGDDVSVERPIDFTNGEDVVVDANLAGTTARFLTAVGALRVGSTTVTGGMALQQRPMSGLFESLSSLGAEVTALGESGHLPVRVRAGDNAAQELTMAGDVSSQFATAILLVAPLRAKGLKLHITGSIVSEPYLTMTCSVMQEFGAHVARTGSDLIEVGTQGYQGRHYVIEPDASSASYPLAAAAIVGGSVTVPGFHQSSTQGDIKFIDLLQKMGCAVRRDESGLTVSRNPEIALFGLQANMASMSDLVPTLAVVAMVASTPTRISGVGFIRNKESDRLSDLADELRTLGGNIEVTDDGLIINPSQVHGGVIDTHHDHRIAMAMSLVGLICDDVIIGDPNVVSKSWPEFWTMLATL